MKKALRLTALAVLLALAACGDGGSNTSTPASEDALNNLVTSEAAINQALLSGAQVALAHGVYFPVPIFIGTTPFSSPLSLATYTWDCQGVTASGDLSDPDADGIPGDARYTGDCTVTSNDQTFTWHLDVALQDRDNRDPTSGFTAAGAVSWEAVGQARLVWTIERHEVARSGSGYDLTYRGNWDYTDLTDASNNATVNYDFTGAWTPDDPNGSSLADLFNRAGTLTLSGRVAVTSETCTASATLDALNVHFDDGGCADSGSLRFTATDCDGQVCNVSVSWSSCGDSGSASVTCSN